MKEFTYQVIPRLDKDNTEQEVIRCEFTTIDCTDEVILANPEGILSNNLSVFLLDNPEFQKTIEDMAELNSKSKKDIPLVFPFTWKYLIDQDITDGEKIIGNIRLVVPIEETSDILRYLNLVEAFTSNFKKGEPTNDSGKRRKSLKSKNGVTRNRKKITPTDRVSR